MDGCTIKETKDGKVKERKKEENIWRKGIEQVCHLEDFDPMNQYYEQGPQEWISFLREEELKNFWTMSLPSQVDFCMPRQVLLVVDFPMGVGGGTAFFLNLILCHYKTWTDFIVVRHHEDERFYMTHNDDALIFQSEKEKETFDYLSSFTNCISKIFINHIQHLPLSFLTSLFSMNIPITTITHDYLWIHKKPQPLYHELISSENIRQPHDGFRQLFSKISTLIVQNPLHIPIFQPYLSDHHHTQIIVEPLPDYMFSGEKIVSTPSVKKRIGIIGSINHTLKGRKILEWVVDSFKNKNYEFVIFGSTWNWPFIEENQEYVQSFFYSSIQHLNELLKEHPPQMLLELSLWPETYSYTLKLGMLTQLPILCLKKEFPSVVESRLRQEYPHHSFFFSNWIELESLLETTTQSYLYTIQPICYFSKFWDYFLEKSIKQ